MGQQPNLHTMRIEDLLDDPTVFIGAIADRVGLDAPDSALAAAARELGEGDGAGGHDVTRMGPLVETLGADMLSAYGYDVGELPIARRLIAKAELGAPGAVAWGLRGAIRRARAARREG
jgi:hypothetical protein